MKSSVVASLALFVCLTAGLRAEELIANGGFEEAASVAFLSQLAPKVREFYGGTADAPFAGWAFGGRFEHGDYAVSISDQAHGGRHSCEIACRKKGRGGVAASPVQLVAGNAIEVSFWLKATDAHGGRVFLNFEGTPGDGWASKELQTGTFGWTHFTKRAIVPGKKGGPAQTIVIFLYTTCEGSIWVDDFSARRVEGDSLDTPAAAVRAPAPISEPADSPADNSVVTCPVNALTFSHHAG